MAKAAALALLAALALACVLRAAPQWHEHLHGAADHQCAATLIGAGNCERPVAPLLHARPHFQVTGPVFVPQLPGAISAGLDFSPLEHAPPALS